MNINHEHMEKAVEGEVMDNPEVLACKGQKKPLIWKDVPVRTAS